MKENGFTDVVTYECLAKNLDVITVNLPKADLGWPDEKVRKSVTDQMARELI